jgi:hypothetical protein
MAAALLALALQETFRLENGLEVVLARVEGHGIAAVGLAYRAGVLGEPEGRCGISHLLEHLFLMGATPSFPRPFETLAEEGPLGSPFMDVNAETMWSATYYYALRPAGRVEEALAIFAEKMAGPALAQETLDRERPRALEEVRNVEAMLKTQPAMRAQLEAFARYPKAGIEAHLTALTLDHLEAYRATHYRPDRAILAVVGEIDVARTRERVRELFGPVKAKEARPLAEGAKEGLPVQQIRAYACAGATEAERDALRAAAPAWQKKLRARGRAYVELPPDGSLRAVLFGEDAAPLDVLRDPLTEAELRAARAEAVQMLRIRRQVVDASRLKPGADRVDYARRLAQAVIDRLIFEADGGQRFLDAVEGVTPQAVAAAVQKHVR